MRPNPWPIHRYKRLSQLCASVALVVSMVALLGWFLNSIRLKAWRADYIPMAPNTALVFIVLAVVLILFTTRRRGRLKALRLCILLAITVPVARLSEYATGLDLSVDRWVFRFPAEHLGLAPVGKMAFFTSATFVLLSASLFLMTFRPRWTNSTAQALAVVIVFIGLLFTLGYAYGNPLTYDWNAIPMALNTAIAFVSCGASVLIRASVRNIMARRSAEMAVRESEERYRLLFESNPLPIWVFDANELAFLAVNQAAVQAYGYTREEFLSMTLRDIRPTEDVPTLLNHLANIPPGIEARMWTHRKKDGTLIDVEVTSHPLIYAGKDARVVLVNDVTARKQAEAAIKQLNKNLEQRGRLLEQANSELEAFSYSVSHDLRAPLRAIDGFSRILLEDHGDKLDGDAGRVLGIIRTNTQNMGKLIDDLLAFSRLGRKQLEKAGVDMNLMATSVANEVTSGLANPPQVQIEKLAHAFGDPALLRQVLMNLVSNATKYSQRSAAPKINIGGHDENGEYIYFVRDNGAGFDMRYANKLFGVFQRLHTAEEFEGTGVGLATVQRIVQRHGGRVWAEGKVDEGATFYFSLPKGREANGNHATCQ